jgi:hypothetical protein
MRECIQEIFFLEVVYRRALLSSPGKNQHRHVARRESWTVRRYSIMNFAHGALEPTVIVM